MAKYNSKRLYNRKISNSGANYNSFNYKSITVLDSATLSDSIIINSVVDTIDLGSSNDNIVLNANTLINDTGTAIESIKNKPVSFYNMGKSYNKRVNNGGANYNTSMDYIVTINDAGTASESIYIPPVSVYTRDDALGSDYVSLVPVLISSSDSAVALDNVSLVGNVDIPDKAVANEQVSLSPIFIPISESGNGLDSINLLKLNASECFIVTNENILEPLGVRVTGDSRHELLPATRDNSEEIPGMHGEFDFGSEFKARALELHVVTNVGYSPLEKSNLQRLFAKYLSPTNGVKRLVFSDDIDKTYMVKYSGKIGINNHPTWFDFVIPFKMSNPLIIGTFEKSITGSGKLVNEGTHETGLLIEITGPITNPTLTIDNETVSYKGAIASGQTLIIDTEKEIAKLGNANAMIGCNGVFPLLYPGETNVIASSNVTIKWKDKWI